MKVLHTISSMGINAGGPTTCLYNLVKGLNIGKTSTKILTYSANANDVLIASDNFIETVPKPFEQRLGFSTKFKMKLSGYSHYDIFHGNGLWQYPTNALASLAKKIKKPYVISTHGMLYPEGLKKSNLLKEIALSLYQRKDLREANVLHATCNQEMYYLIALGFINPIAVIPNAIDITTVLPKIIGLKKEKKQIGFLGRFAPIKNLDILLKAWAEAGKNNPNWELVLIGDGDINYKNQLIQLAEKLNIKNICVKGFLSGLEKEKALQSLDYLVLPSKSENFGMVVPEALIREIPVIASNGTPWEELNTYNAGWWIDIGVDPLVEALENALNLSDEERQIIGKNGRKLVEEKYSIEAVAQQMIELYQWILKVGEKPEFVHEQS